MDAVEHYREAELNMLMAGDEDEGSTGQAVHLQFAQVHALLALVAVSDSPRIDVLPAAPDLAIIEVVQELLRSETPDDSPRAD